MAFLLPETLLLAVILYVTPQVKQNFLIPASGMALCAYFLLALIDHNVATNPYATYQSVAIIVLAGAFGISTFLSLWSSLSRK